MHTRLEQLARHTVAPAILLTLLLLVSYLAELLTFSNTHAIFLWLHDTGEFGSVPHTHRLAFPLWIFPLVILATLGLLAFICHGLTRLWLPKRKGASESARPAENEAVE